MQRNRLRYIIRYGIIAICIFVIIPISFASARYGKPEGPVNTESYDMYANPPENLPANTIHMNIPPRTIDKGDFYTTREGKVKLLRSRDHIAITGDDEDIEGLIKKAHDKGGKKKEKIHTDKDAHKSTYIYAFDDVQEEDLASELLEKLKASPKAHFVSPVFYTEQGGFKMVLTDRITVKLKDGFTESDLEAINPPYVRMKNAGYDVYILSIQDAKTRDILELAQWYGDFDIIEWSHPVFIGEIRNLWDPSDPLFDDQWHLDDSSQNADVHAPDAWDLTTGDPNIIVAVMNSGVQTDHPDLKAGIWTNPADPNGGGDDDNNGYPDDIHGWNFKDNDNNVNPSADDDNHGTCCAGVLGARSNGTGCVGIAPNITILPIKVMTSIFWCDSEHMAKAIRYAGRYADILSMSFAYAPADDVHQAIKDISRVDPNSGRGGKGCVVFAASGNTADGFQELYSGDAIPPGRFLAGSSAISPGWHLYGFVYRKDGNDYLPNDSDSVWVDRIIWQDGFIETFDFGIPPNWNTGGGVNGFPRDPAFPNPWYAFQDDRHYFLGANRTSVKSGNIGHEQYTFLEVWKYSETAGDVKIYFWTSTEPSDPGDRFEFYIDGECFYVWKGETKSSYGNDKPVQTTPWHPAAFPETIAVGSCTDGNFRSCYSCFGPELDFVAPSDGGSRGITTTDRTGADGYNPGDDYFDQFGGTSSACPLAAGIGALVLSREPNLTSADVRQRLRDTADKIDQDQHPYNADGRNDQYGYGRVNAYMALTPDLDPPTNVQASDGTYTDGIHITWNPVKGAMWYNIYRATSAGGAKTLIRSNNTTTSYIDLPPISKQTYYYWIKAANERVESDFSAYDSGWQWNIQTLLDNAANGDVIVLQPGVYIENISFPNSVPSKAITLRSTDPNDPDIVASTIIQGTGFGSVISFASGVGSGSGLNGITIRNGHYTYGGGIYCAGSPTIVNCVITDNYASYRGGGIYVYSASPTITNCTIDDNSSYAEGGGIACYNYSNPTISNCTISGNSSGSRGGGIWCYRSAPSIVDCTIADNSAGYGGGIQCQYYSSPVIKKSTIVSNNASYYGGGADSWNYSTPAITNCVFSSNSSPKGGGLSYRNCSLSYLTNCTIVQNSSSVNGGGVHSYLSYLNIANCIVWENDAPGSPPNQIYTDLGSVSVTYSDIQYGYADPGGTNIDADPFFVDSIAGDLHLTIDSSCIDTGTSQGAPNEDKDGNPRPLGLGYDMGAYECILVIRNVPGDFPTIQGAIDAADESDIIMVSPGTYAEHIDFQGKNITVRSIDPKDPDVVAMTIIDGGHTGSVVVFQNGEGESASLRGMTIRNGYAQFGGGIHCFESSPTIANCVITGNTAYAGPGYLSLGGGIFLIYSNARIIDCRIIENTASQGDYHAYGGGMMFQSSSPDIMNCTFTDNEAGYGGAIFFYDSSPAIDDCTFTYNTAAMYGGAISTDHATSGTSITDCIMTDNMTTNTSSVTGGGGILLLASAGTISNCTIDWNHSSYYGGGMVICNYSSPTIMNCSFNDNSAAYQGGGIHVDYYSTPTITNCTISGNSAYRAGGMYCSYSAPTIIDSTISDNSATSSNGGIRWYGNCGSSGSMINCIIARNSGSSSGGGMYFYNCRSYVNIMNCTFTQNTATYGGGIYCSSYSYPVFKNCIFWENAGGEFYGSGPTVTYSDIMGGRSGQGNINADPLFMDPDNPDAPDFHLSAGSPCIDTGTNIGAPATDKDGVPRPQDGNNNGEALYDMGAYEYVYIL